MNYWYEVTYIFPVTERGTIIRTATSAEVTKIMPRSKYPLPASVASYVEPNKPRNSVEYQNNTEINKDYFPTRKAANDFIKWALSEK